MSKSKEIFFNTISRLIPNQLFKPLINLAGRNFYIPFYHTVSDNNPAHVKYLYPVINVKQFEADIDLVARNFVPVDLNQLIEIVKTKKKISKPVIHFTFDDGFSEFYDIAAPILLKKGIQATCFLNSGFIDNKDLFFRCKASLLIDLLHNEKTGSPVWKSYHDFISVNKIPHQYYQDFLLSIGYDKRETLDKLAHEVGIDFNQFLQRQKPYLSTDQIKQLIKKGFTFGAHSIDHPNYRFLSEEERLRQTKESMETICSTFNLNYKAFSFPFTDFELSRSFFNTIFENKIVDITFGSAGIKNDSAVYNLHRFSGESNIPGMKGIINKELQYFLLLKLLRKQTIQRL
jgi:peptidoglycan/xylan/chitin deacetylase (PgdA/CDA1 family)